MLSGEFERKIRQLNKDLKIFCGNNSNSPAGLYRFKRSEFDESLGGSYDSICSVDKNWVPEHTMFNDNGTIHKGGWRRVLRMLIKRRLVDRWYAEKVFGTRLSYAPQKISVPKPKRDTRALDQFTARPERGNYR